MDDLLFREIANEIKGLNNQAFKLISRGRLTEAEAMCQRGLETTRNLAYYDGMATFLFNLANLEILRDDLLKAMEYGALCGEMHTKSQTDAADCDALMKDLAKAAMKKGVEHEKKGDFRAALEYYYASLPFSEEKYRQAMLKEIRLIERLVNSG